MNKAAVYTRVNGDMQNATHLQTRLILRWTCRLHAVVDVGQSGVDVRLCGECSMHAAWMSI